MGRTITFQEAIHQVKLNLDIVDVVGRHVVLKRAGRNMMGLCPFHQEKSPSFTVNPAKQVFKCFGCGEGGDALTFLMKIEGKGFGDLIGELAEDQGLEIQRENRPDAPSRDELDILYELNSAARQFYQSNLHSAADILNYLSDRQVDPHWQDVFGLGYAPAGWENLVPHLTKTIPAAHTSPMLMEKAGLANLRTEGNSFYDRFRNRLMVPIQDERGRVVGFGGRSLSDADQPKYLNSPETPVYIKSRILYGLNLAKDTIRASKTAILMEGYFDVIAAHMAGITQAVGVCGTALTESHLKLLQRAGAEKIYLCFDSDKAGQSAALRAIELVENHVLDKNIMLYVIKLTGDDKDPDDFLKHQGRDAFLACMNAAPDFLSFQFDSALSGIDDLHTPKGRITAVQTLTPMLNGIGQPIVRQEKLKQLAQQIGVDEETLQLEIKRLQKNNPGYPDKNNYDSGAISFLPQRYTGRSKNNKRYEPSRLRPEDTTAFRSRLEPKIPVEDKEHLLLSMLFLELESYWMVMDKLTQLTLKSPLANRLLEAVLSLEGQWQTLDELVNQLNSQFHAGEDDAMLSFLAQQAIQADSWQTQAAPVAKGSVKGLKTVDVSEKLRRDIEEIVSRIKTSQRQAGMEVLADNARKHEEQLDDLAAMTAQHELKARLEARLLNRKSDSGVLIAEAQIETVPTSVPVQNV